MSSWNPCKRKDFIKRLRGLGFEGVYSGAKHQFMIYGNNRLTVPSNNVILCSSIKNDAARSRRDYRAKNFR